jgi:hypothetical protein
VPPFLTLALDGGEWSASHHGRFTPKERTLGTLWVGGWADLGTVKRNICPYRDSNPGILCYNDRATPTPGLLVILSLSVGAAVHDGTWSLFLQFQSYTGGRTPWWWGSSPPQGRYLNARQHKHRINAEPCLEWDSNQLPQCFSGRRQFMPQTARQLWSESSATNWYFCTCFPLKRRNYKSGTHDLLCKAWTDRELVYNAQGRISNNILYVW